MTKNDYVIEYSGIDDLTFKSKKSILEYLNSEEEAWRPFFDTANEFLSDLLISKLYSHQSHHWDYERVFSRPKEWVETPEVFNERIKNVRTGRLLPPPSYSRQGQLVLRLSKQGNVSEASQVFYYYLFALHSIEPKNDQFAWYSTGKKLELASLVAQASASTEVSASELEAMKQSGQRITDDLKRHYDAAAAASKQQSEGFIKLLEGWNNGFDQLQELGLANQDSLATESRDQVAEQGSVFEIASQKQAEKLLGIAKVMQTKARRYDSEFDDLKKRFLEDLKYRVPVKLWSSRVEMHQQKSKQAMRSFTIFACVAATVGVGVPVLFGDFIAKSFYDEVCKVDGDCVRLFSPKGPLLVSGLLLITSMMLWVLRLMYRVFLSERHLSLDAEERAAFAETFLGLLEDDSVGKESEAIVLASLFRPTQDGIIRDDDSSVDLSAAAVLAKQLGRPT